MDPTCGFPKLVATHCTLSPTNCKWKLLPPQVSKTICYKKYALGLQQAKDEISNREGTDLEEGLVEMTMDYKMKKSLDQVRSYKRLDKRSMWHTIAITND